MWNRRARRNWITWCWPWLPWLWVCWWLTGFTAFWFRDVWRVARRGVLGWLTVVIVIGSVVTFVEVWCKKIAFFALSSLSAVGKLMVLRFLMTRRSFISLCCYGYYYGCCYSMACDHFLPLISQIIIPPSVLWVVVWRVVLIRSCNFRGWFCSLWKRVGWSWVCPSWSGNFRRFTRAPFPFCSYCTLAISLLMDHRMLGSGWSYGGFFITRVTSFMSRVMTGWRVAGWCGSFVILGLLDF